MRALGAFLLLAAQLRPVLGVVLCAVAGPAVPAGATECGPGERTSTETHHTAGGPAWTTVGAEDAQGCTLTDLCRPAFPAPLLAAAETRAPEIAGRTPQLPPLSWNDPFGLAPPTPPPNS
jgi:hypothetical protein